MNRVIALCFFLLFSKGLFAGVLTEGDLRISVVKHHPKIKIELEKIKATQGQARSKQGQVLDTTLQAESQIRTSGYYSGDSYDVRLSKPIPWMNASVYGGYRRSNGEFPIYEEGFITNDSGEVMAGVKVSLLRDGRSTSKLMGYHNALLEVELAELNLELEKMALLRKASKLYWTWVVIGHISEAYHDLYQTALERHQGIQSRFKRGDVPKTYVMENEQYILQRHSDYLMAKQKFETVGRELSLYARGENGAPMDLSLISPDKLPSPDALEIDLIQLSKTKLESHPQLLSLILIQKQIQNELKAVQNQNYPSIDLAYEIADDMGTGPDSRDQAESKLKAKIQIPLERRDANGKTHELRSKHTKITEEAQWVEAQLRLQLENGVTALQFIQQIVKNQKQARELSLTLFKAEETRFKLGDSDFFHLNLSQQNLIKATLDYYYSCLDLKSQTVETTWILL